MNWALLVEAFGVTALGIIGGIVVFVCYGLSRQERQQTEAERLSEEHQNASHCENCLRIDLVYRIMEAKDPYVKEHLRQQYCDMEAYHQELWNARVKKIIDTEMPYDDAVMESIRRGENPYRTGRS